MPIRVKCGGCKKTLSVKDHLAGKKIKCPVCQNVVAVSASAPPKAAGPAASAGPKSAAPPKKPGPAPKPGVAVKPPPDKSKSNGTPAPADIAKSNGVPAPPAPIELPPENVEAEALAAFRDEPKPAEEEAAPQFIEFKCDWCDENVKLPMELAGKQAQCPNPECKRLVKVPLPKKAEKKDWKKMDQKGPAAAIINQPEQLENAWGTEVASKAKQSSLAQAGAVAEPVKPPVGVAGWLSRGVKVLGVLALLLVAGVAGYNLFATKQQHNALAEAKKLVEGTDAKIKQPVLAAEAHRTIGLLYLGEGKAVKAQVDHFQGAGVIAGLELKKAKREGVNEQMFLIDLALSQIELGGDGADLLGGNRLEWKDVLPDLANTLGKIKNPEVQAMAMREVGTRLIDKKQAGLAVGLSAGLSNQDGKKQRPTPFRQQIALRFILPDPNDTLGKLVKRPDPDDAKPLADGHARVGYAEGYARKDDFDAARKLANRPGPVKDKLDALLGVAAVAWQRKNKDKANDCCTDALALPKDALVTEWQKLQMVQLAARVERSGEVKELVTTMKAPFQLRAQLEIFLALCERTPGYVNADALQELESADKDGTTLALAWMALARHNARIGASRDRNRATFEERIAAITLPAEIVEKIRPMVDIGSYLGGVK